MYYNTKHKLNTIMNTTHTFNNESTYINDCIIFAFTIITAITIYKWIQSLTNKKNNYNIDINISIYTIAGFCIFTFTTSIQKELIS